VSFFPFRKPLKANTASPANPLPILGTGAVLLQHTIVQNKKIEVKYLWIELVLFVPWIMARLLSLGQFLKEGMHIYGNDAMISLHLPDQTPVLQCEPGSSSEDNPNIYWLLANLAQAQDVHSIFKVDYDIMHCRLAHLSKEVLRKARSSTKGFPEISFPWDNPLCPGCALGKMPQKPFLSPAPGNRSGTAVGPG